MTDQVSQDLEQDYSEYGGDFSGSDYWFEDTYQDADFDYSDSVIQGDISTDPIPVITITAPRLPKDSAIEALNLSDAVKEYAYQLKDSHPTIVFTSGKRSVYGQARAMAGNVMENRQWIGNMNYSNKPLRNALQQWVNAHPGATTRAQITAGLASVFATWPPDVVTKFSLHMIGNAFDVKPVDGPEGNAIHDQMRNLPGTFLDRENNQRRWHFQKR